MIDAFTLLVASEANRGLERRFHCGYCNGQHAMHLDRLEDHARYVIRHGCGEASCVVPGAFATAWEAAARVALAVSLGGHLHQLQRDGKLF